MNFNPPPLPPRDQHYCLWPFHYGGGAHVPWVPHPSPWSPHPSPWAPQPSPGPLPFAPWKPGDAFSTEEEPWAPFPPASGPWHTGDQIRYTVLFLPSSQRALAHRGSDQVHRALPFLQPAGLAHRGSVQVHSNPPSLQPSGPGKLGIRSGTESSSFPPASEPWHIGDQIRYTGLLLPSIQPLLPDGRILGCRTKKWPCINSCGLGNQRPRKWSNSKFHNFGLILTIIGKNWPNNLHT